jgi:hypothetical protein
MSSITIMREIILKQIVTERSKEITKERINNEVASLKEEIDAYEEEKNKTITEFTLRGAEEVHLKTLRQKFDAEMGKFFIRREELSLEMESINALQENEEIVIGSVEGPVDLKVGDSFQALSQTQIVLKDGVIVDIRL